MNTSRGKQYSQLQIFLSLLDSNIVVKILIFEEYSPIGEWRWVHR